MLLLAVEPLDVTRLLVGTEGVGLLWVTMSVGARVGIVAEGLVSRNVVVFWVVFFVDMS